MFKMLPKNLLACFVVGNAVAANALLVPTVQRMQTWCSSLTTNQAEVSTSSAKIDEAKAVLAERLPFTIPDNVVWTQLVCSATSESYVEGSFSESDGSIHRIATYIQAQNIYPSYWSAENLPSLPSSNQQDTFDACTNFVFQMLYYPDASVSVSAVTNLLDRSEVTITQLGMPVEIPFEQFYFVFVDERPGANWSHPCAYVFIAPDFSSFILFFCSYSPVIKLVSDNSRIRLKSDKSLNSPALSLSAITNSVYLSTNAVTATSNISYLGDTSKSYAVIIQGGANPDYNGIRFWVDAAMMYSTLTLYYGIPKDNITVIMSDGTDTGEDANLMDEDNPALVSSPQDLDGDGENDVNYAATHNNVKNVFDFYKNKLTEKDQLYVFISSHGSYVGTESSENYSSGVWLYSPNGDQKDLDGNNAFIYDYEFSSWTKDIKCPIAFAVEACYSGGLIDDIITTPNRFIATACNHYESSWGYGGGGEWDNDEVGKICSFNTWAYAWITALRGYQPKMKLTYTKNSFIGYTYTCTYAYPWESSTTVVNADSDGDNTVSFLEAVDYALKNDMLVCTASEHTGNCGNVEHPQYGESETDLGSAFSILRLPKIYIDGDTSVMSESSIALTCYATISSIIAYEVTPKWSIVQGAEYATISTDGVLTAKEVKQETTIVIGATYTEDGVTETATHSVTLLPFPLPKNLKISGFTSLFPPCTYTYTCTVTMDNGETKTVTPVWSIISGSEYATITQTGVLNATKVSAETVITIKATYTEREVTKVTTFVVTLEPELTLAVALDCSKLTFSTSGDADWYPQTNYTHDGIAAARSGNIGNSKNSELSVTVTGPGTLSFWWYVSCENASRRQLYDYLGFYDNDERVGYIYGTNKSWQYCTYEITTEETHTLTWTYYKDSSRSSGLDAAFVDQVVWKPKVEEVVIPSTVTGDSSLTITEEWVNTELTESYGEETATRFTELYGSDFSEAVLKPTGKKDVDGNPLYVWQDFIAGTDPTDTNSVFRATIVYSNGLPVVTWSPNLNTSTTPEKRAYRVYGADSITGPWVEETSNPPTKRFFKVSVDMP